MNEFAAILSAGVLPRLGEDIGLPGGVKKWLTTGNFVPEPNENGTFTLNRIPISEYANALCSDFERFSLASLETYIVATSEYREYGAASWPFLKIYYSSFFAGHALLRARGAGVVNLDSAQTEYINAILTTYSDGAPLISPGTYFLEYFPTTGVGRGEIAVQISPKPKGKGVHEAFWRTFAQYMVDEAKRAIKDEAPDSATFLTYSTSLKEAVLEGGSESSWLSTIRNKINYQHGYETWMPFRKRSEANVISIPASNTPFSAASLDIQKSKKPLEAFVNISCYISNLNIGISERISQRSTKGNTFGQKWRRLNAQLKT